jgi:hypothetical protein
MSFEKLTILREKIIENLRSIPHAPSAQMQSKRTSEF